MNSLFDGFDLTPNSKTAEKAAATKKKPTKEKKNNKQLTNQSLFSDSLDEFNIELNNPRVETLLSKLNEA